MKILGKITNAEMQKDCVITFITDDNLKNEEKVRINTPNPDGSMGRQYFQVIGVSITEDSKLKVQAKEVGYWARALSRREGFDLRSLISVEVEHLTDKEDLKKLHEMMCWC